ncbi:hypothetical protein L798_14373 [Zootermopsis nevadensis]|uniref:Uncharacterized protein n=1 Tax=Zootermopsis nevadensis TaxID=136037 RepID=A0A067QN12_ZOONE|nr:hypothetical protein L798_14373 [Zootermopsis nevadensis]
MVGMPGHDTFWTNHKAVVMDVEDGVICGGTGNSVLRADDGGCSAMPF